MSFSDTERDPNNPPLNSDLIKPLLTKSYKSLRLIAVRSEILARVERRASSKSVLFGELVRTVRTFGTDGLTAHAESFTSRLFAFAPDFQAFSRCLHFRQTLGFEGDHSAVPVERDGPEGVATETPLSHVG